ncbi:MAG: hypothetical protein P1U83_03195 [Roseovarius sp.]|nr:hypothetical protein [Roseovarius sp.]
MNTLFKVLFLTLLLLSGQGTLATPQGDANFIVQRNFDAAWMKIVHRKLKEAFVVVYFRPIAGLGVKIADEDKFIDIIPDEAIAPYVDRLMSKTAERYLSVYTPEQLASVVAVMRADTDATMEKILSEDYQRLHAAALEQARTNAQRSGSDDPLVIELEELTVQLNAFVTMLDGDGGEAIGQSIALGLDPLFLLMGYTREITQIEQKPDNPITIAALRADGILSFANFVQRQTLLQQFSTSDRTGGILFAKPPANSTQSD